jgi:hypothetical protein
LPFWSLSLRGHGGAAVRSDSIAAAWRLPKSGWWGGGAALRNSILMDNTAPFQRRAVQMEMFGGDAHASSSSGLTPYALT